MDGNVGCPKDYTTKAENYAQIITKILECQI